MTKGRTQGDVTTDTSDREIVTTRIFDAPRELVWKAWTDPKHIAHWWGPNGFTNTIHKMDVRPGGVWQFTMHGPDGVDYPNRIVKPERIAYDHGDDVAGKPADFHSTVTFEAQGDKTKVTLRLLFATVAECNKAVTDFGAVEGGQQTFNRLGGYLAKTIETSHPTIEPADLEIVSTRVFAAPRELVFEAFSNPNHLIHWWGPKDFTNTFQEFDLRPGGAWRLVMHGPDGTDYPTAKDFVEVMKPERIVFQQLGTTHRWLTTMTFSEHSGSTTLTWRMLFETATEFAKVKSHIITANEENLDRLEVYLEKLAPKSRNA